MSIYDARFTPLGALESGTQQVVVGASPVLASDVFDLSGNTNSLWLQASAALEYRLNGDTTGAAFLTLAAGDILPLANKAMLLGLVLRSASGSVPVTVQLFTGSVGPFAAPPTAGGGGSGPPPPPGITSIPTQNVVHVMKNGDDGSGQRNRLDLPFLTITAAKAVLQAGDTMCIWPGTYAEGGIDVINVTYLLLGAEIQAPEAQHVFSFAGNGGVGIAGSGVLSSSDESGTKAVVRAGNGTGLLRIAGLLILSDYNSCLQVVDGWQAIAHVDMFCDATDNYACEGNTTTFGTILGEATGLLCRDGQVQTHSGVISTALIQAVCEGGEQIVSGAVSRSEYSTVRCTGGKQTIYASVGVAHCNGGVQNIWGDCYTSPENTASLCRVGAQTIHGSCIGGAGADCESGTQIVMGDCHSTSENGTYAAFAKSTGKQIVYGTCTSVAESAAHAGGTSEQTIYGDCIGGPGFPGAVCIASARQTLGGRISSLDPTKSAAVNTGTLDTPTLILLATARLVTDGVQPCIDGSLNATIISYGAYANSALAPGFTYDGDLNVHPFVI